MKTDNLLLIRIFESRKARAILVAVTIIISLIITAIIVKVNDVSINDESVVAWVWVVVWYAIYFPIGLIWSMPAGVVTMLTGGEGGGIGMVFSHLLYIFLGWILYWGLALLIVRATKFRTAFILYMLLIFLLVANIAGCNIAMAEY